MGTFDPSQPRRIILTMIRWTRGHGNKDWDVRMKEYTSFKVVITASFYISPLATARQMWLMIAQICRCVSERRGTRPGSSDSGAVDQTLWSATNRDRRDIACDSDDGNSSTRGTEAATECEESKLPNWWRQIRWFFVETFRARTLRRVDACAIISSHLRLLLDWNNYKAASKLLMQRISKLKSFSRMYISLFHIASRCLNSFGIS